MELRHLRYFLAVAQEGGFRRAAASIHLAQQALSRQIADLERELGAELFERSRRGAKLSAAGQELLPRARRIVSEADAAVRTVRDAARGESAALRVAHIDPIYFAGLFGRALHDFRMRPLAPRLRIEPLTTMQQLEALRAGQIDVGLGGVLTEGEPGMQTEIVDTRFFSGVFMSDQHPLAVIQSLGTEDLEGERIAMVPLESNPKAVRGMLEQLFKAGVRPNGVDHVASVALTLELVEHDRMLMLGDPDGYDGVPRGITFRSVRDLRIPYNLYARWWQAESNPLIGALLDSLRLAAHAGPVS
jgi:DNA-binding transcriptional LysR family regulator